MNQLIKVKLEDKQLSVLNDSLTEMEDLMSLFIDHKDSDKIAEQLARAIKLISLTGRMAETATRMIEYAKGKAALDIITNDKLKTLGTTHQFKIIDAQISDYTALYERTDRTIKGLTAYIRAMEILLTRK